MEILLLIGLIGLFWSLVPAFICSHVLYHKGHSSCAGILFALVLGWIAVIVCLLIPENAQAIEEENLRKGINKKCPECLYGIPAEARRCGHCGAVLTAESELQIPKPKHKASRILEPLKEDSSDIPYHSRRKEDGSRLTPF